MKVKYSYLALSIVFASFVSFLSLPVYAQSANESELESEFEQTQKDINTYKKEVEVKKQEAKQRVEQKTAEIKTEAEAKAKEAKEKADQSRQEIKKQLCQTKSDNLNSIVQKRAETARAFYERFSGFSDKIDRFIEVKNLKVDNYAELSKSLVDTSTKADEAITTLEGLKFEVNCQDVELTKANTQSYRNAVISAKEALKEYKTALVNMLTAVVTSYNTSNPGSTEATNSNSNDSFDSSSNTTKNNTEGVDTSRTSTVNTEEPSNAQ